MEIHRMMVLSTSHVSEATANRIDSGRMGIAASFTRAEGWVFAVDLPLGLGVPEDLAGVLEHAGANGCNYVMLDRDGPVELSLPTYSW